MSTQTENAKNFATIDNNMLSVAEKCIVNEKPIFEKVYQKDIRDFLEDDRDDEPLL